MLDYEDRVDRIPDWSLPGSDRPADIEISPQGWRYSKDDQWTSDPYPLAAAVWRCSDSPANRPAIIEVHGKVHGAGHMLGGGNAGGQANKAHWNGVPLNLVIRGAHGPSEDEIRDITFWTHDGTEKSGGVGYVRFENLTIRNAWSDRAIGSVAHQMHNQSGKVGVIHLRDVHLRGKNREDYGGFGMKFGIRSLAGLSYRLDGVICHGAQEHFCYVNSPQKGEDGCSLAARRIWHKGSWRTGFQVVDRPLESNLPMPRGHLLFERIALHNVSGEGGGGITVAGHMGEITVLDYFYGEGSRHSALAIWHPMNPIQGWRADEDGFMNGSTLLNDIRVDTPTANQDAIQVDRARRLQVGRRFDILSAKTALDLGKIGPRGQGPLKNPAIGFEWAKPPGLSKHPGLQRGTGRRVTADLWNSTTGSYNPNVELTDDQIDQFHMLQENNR